MDTILADDMIAGFDGMKRGTEHAKADQMEPAIHAFTAAMFAFRLAGMTEAARNAGEMARKAAERGKAAA